MAGVSVFKNLESLADQEVDVLSAIQSAVASLAATRGIAADLRVTVVSQPSTVIGSGTVTTVTTVTTLANQTNMGGVPANYTVPAQQNTLVANSFAQNIDRGNGGARYG